VKPRVKLITVPWELEVPTLALASIAAVTPARFEIAIVDLLRERLNLDEPVDLVGISASTPRIGAAYALAEIYRKKGAKVVIGGHHATALPEEALGHADAVVCGEGETSWMRICDEFLTNPATVAGVYREAGPDPATLPQPRIDLMKIERYGPFSFPLIATRGCPEACSFCFARQMTSGFRTYPIAHVVEQVRRRPAGVRAAYFVDDNLPGDGDYARELFRELRRYQLPFGMQARHEFAQNHDDLALARAAGCALISSGYESVNQETLRRTGKRARAAEYFASIENVFCAGIMPSGNWMFGFDWDTPDIFDETLAFLDGSKLLHCSFTSEVPFPGTAAFRKYDAEGRILTYDYEKYRGKDHVVVKPKHMTPEELQRGIRRLAMAFYSPARAFRRARLALANDRLAAGPAALRVPGLVSLNLFQSVQWTYRMSPPLNWLYRRLESVNKYRYLKDLVRRTNFWSSRYRRADERFDYGPLELQTRSPFATQGGHKPRRRDPLVALGASRKRFEAET
jgi:radical SAM superfamily enzyme YgiQ (UPF0313 family)